MNDLDNYDDDDDELIVVNAHEVVLINGYVLAWAQTTLKKNDAGGLNVLRIEQCGDGPYSKWLQRQFPKKSSAKEDKNGLNS